MGACRARPSNRQRPGLAASGLNWLSGIAQGPPRRTVLRLGASCPSPATGQAADRHREPGRPCGESTRHKNLVRAVSSGVPGGQVCCREVRQGTKPCLEKFKMCQYPAQSIAIAIAVAVVVLSSSCRASDSDCSIWALGNASRFRCVVRPGSCIDQFSAKPTKRTHPVFAGGAASSRQAIQSRFSRMLDASQINGPRWLPLKRHNNAEGRTCALSRYSRSGILHLKSP